MPHYSYRNRAPAFLPKGMIVTAPDGHQYWMEELPTGPKELMDLGFVLVSDPPVIDPEMEMLDWEDGRWMVYPRPNETGIRCAKAKVDRLAELAMVRWQKQQDFIYQGKLALSDDVTIGRVVAKVFAAQLAQTPPTTTSLWKFGPDNFQQVTTRDLVAYGTAINQHVQGCFDYEAALTARINAATTAEAVMAINIQTGWPN